MSARQIAEHYRVSKVAVKYHIAQIFSEGELDRSSAIKQSESQADTDQAHPPYREKEYSLEVVLAVGFRLRSPLGRQFRQWVTDQLCELLEKGFVQDEERLAISNANKQFFDQLVMRIRDIRASERVFQRKLISLYATSIDYDPSSPTTRDFFSNLQNKLHWATHGRTAAELIVQRADAGRPNMGLTTWANAPSGPVRKSDVNIAKNYLWPGELAELNRIVSMFLDYAEDQARRGRPMYMADWLAKLDAFLQFNERAVLTNKGSVTPEQAQQFALAQYALYLQRGQAAPPNSPAALAEKE